MDVAILSSLSSQALLYPSTLLLFKCSDHWPIPLSTYTCCSLFHALIFQPNLALKGSRLKASSIFCHVLTNNSPCPSPCSCYCQGLSWYNCQISLKRLYQGSLSPTPFFLGVSASLLVILPGPPLSPFHEQIILSQCLEAIPPLYHPSIAFARSAWLFTNVCPSCSHFPSVLWQASEA